MKNTLLSLGSPRSIIQPQWASGIPLNFTALDPIFKETYNNAYNVRFALRGHNNAIPDSYRHSLFHSIC